MVAPKACAAENESEDQNRHKTDAEGHLPSLAVSHYRFAYETTFALQFQTEVPAVRHTSTILYFLCPMSIGTYICAGP